MYGDLPLLYSNFTVDVRELPAVRRSSSCPSDRPDETLHYIVVYAHTLH